MAAPTNISFATATDLGTLPATVTQRVDDSGTTYTVYYSWTAAADGMAGVLGYGDFATYQPTMHVYLGPAGAPVLLGINGKEKALAPIPQTAGVQYFLSITSNAGNPSPANLTLNVQVFSPSTSLSLGAIAVPDDSAGILSDNSTLPLAILSSTTAAPLRYIADFPVGEAGDVLNDGTAFVDDSLNGQGVIVTGQYVPVTTTPQQPRINGIKALPDLNAWIVNTRESANGRIRQVSSTGTVGPIIGTLGAAAAAVAASRDGTILYYTTTVGSANQPIKRWSLVSDSALSDLVAGVANYKNQDIYVLADDSVVVMRERTGVNSVAVRYDAAGTTLNTYTFGSNGSNDFVTLLARALDDPTSFWIWFHPTGPPVGFSTFKNILTADGTEIASFSAVNFETAVSRQVASASPTRFGHSPSCPFWITRTGSATTRQLTIRRQRRFLLPSSDSNHYLKIPTIELLGRGNGLTPGPSGSPVQGEAPILMVRLSKDGGKTWLPERQIPAGLMGNYLARWRLLRATGNYRNAVLEVTVSDPVDWQMIEAFAPNGIEEGTS